MNPPFLAGIFRFAASGREKKRLPQARESISSKTRYKLDYNSRLLICFLALVGNSSRSSTVHHAQLVLLLLRVCLATRARLAGRGRGFRKDKHFSDNTNSRSSCLLLGVLQSSEFLRTPWTDCQELSTGSMCQEHCSVTKRLSTPNDTLSDSPRSIDEALFPPTPLTGTDTLVGVEIIEL